MEIFWALAISLGINILMFIPAFLFKTDKLTDMSYALTFVVVVWWELVKFGTTLPSFIVVAMVTIWAARLGTYLLIRIHKMGRDKRFDEMRGDFLKFAGFWLLQGFTVWAVLIPSILFIANQNISTSVWAY